MLRAADRRDAGTLPPEVEITSPEWYAQLDPTKPSFDVRGTVFARGAAPTPARCSWRRAPTPTTAPGRRRRRLREGRLDRVRRHQAAHGRAGRPARRPWTWRPCKARFPAGTPATFDGREPAAPAAQTSNGRPNTAPYGFVREGGGEARCRRHDARGRGPPPGLPAPRRGPAAPTSRASCGTDGASSPLFVDLDGDNRNELVFGTSDGFVHALRRDGSTPAGLARARRQAAAAHRRARVHHRRRLARTSAAPSSPRRRRATSTATARPRSWPPTSRARSTPGTPTGERVLTEESKPDVLGQAARRRS